jgi:hypothetical protein
MISSRSLILVALVGCGGGGGYVAAPVSTARGDGYEVSCFDKVSNCDEGAKKSCAPKKAIVIGNSEEQVDGRWKYTRIAVCRGT